MEIFDDWLRKKVRGLSRCECSNSDIRKRGGDGRVGVTEASVTDFEARYADFCGTRDFIR